MDYFHDLLIWDMNGIYPFIPQKMWFFRFLRQPKNDRPSMAGTGPDLDLFPGIFPRRLGQTKLLQPGDLRSTVLAVFTERDGYRWLPSGYVKIAIENGSL